MKILVDVTPTPEQLPIISNPQEGVTLIRGSAGAGKTTTALLMLELLTNFWVRRAERLGHTTTTRVLVLTFNKTLRGYISHLANQKVAKSMHIDLTVSTFAKWACGLVGSFQMIASGTQRREILKNSSPLKLPDDFLLDEVDYCMGRFLAENRDDYLQAIRLGRGQAPRVNRQMREYLLNEVILPYERYKTSNGLADWNDVALALEAKQCQSRYDIIIADETQDFSANQMRATIKQAADPSTIVFVLDAVQRIYPRGWSWKEVGIEVIANRSFRLKENHRNTKEICQLAKPLLEGLDVSDDGTIPDLNTCVKRGALPCVIIGKYWQQSQYALSQIQQKIDLSSESVAFMHVQTS